MTQEDHKACYERRNHLQIRWLGGDLVGILIVGEWVW